MKENDRIEGRIEAQKLGAMIDGGVVGDGTKIGFVPWTHFQEAGLKLAVYLDGKHKTECISADTNTGEVVSAERGADGAIKKDVERPDEIAKITEKGSVEIVVRKADVK